MMGSKSDQFVNDLVQFYRNKGHHNTQPQQFVARINGKVVDLNELYSHVIGSGGSFKVTQLNLWDEIYCKLFRTSTVGANISVALRQIYARYLLPYEKVFSTNFTNDLLDDDDDDSNFSFNASHNHNYSFNNQNSLTTPSYSTYSYQCPPILTPSSVSENRNPINKLFCSLLSGLPNELDFALKVSTILINSNRFNWVSDYRFVELLLECSKNYCCVCDHPNNFSEEIFVDSQSDTFESEQNSCNCYDKFWFQCCSDEQTLELCLGTPDPLIELPQQDFNKIEDRIRLIAEIIRNLSFTYDSENVNAFSLSTGCVGGCSTLLMKFLLLLTNSSIQKFNYIALDILSNIAPITAFIQEDNDYRLIQQILYRRCVEVSMTSNDIHWTSRALEVTSRLFSTNIEELSGYLESFLREYEVFTRITQLMTCQYDITLLLAILEFCFALSQQRPNLLVKDDNKHLIKMLLTLLNIESSQHFNSSALKRMRVIDDRPRNQTSDTSSTQQAVSVVTTGQNSSQLNVDNETFAMNWLRSTYEPTANLTDNQSLKASDVYAEYVKHSCRNSRRNVMAAQPFSQLIKKCFPSSSLTNNQTTIEGIVVKSVQNITQNKSNGTSTPLLMSPILKAHLSAPPKSTSTSSTSTNSTNSTAMTTSQSTTSTILPVPTTNTSTLIKSLLANKLRSNATISTTSSPSNTTTLNSCSNTSVTPTKSSTVTFVSTSPSAKMTTLTTSPVPTNSTTTVNINSTISETNGESIVVITSSPPLPSAITITPSVSTISLTPNNTHLISTSNANISAQSVQPQQQFLLVRTIITSPGQQQSGNNLTTTGTPVRLILPASMLTQQRLTVPTMNGIATTSSNLTNMTFTAANSSTHNHIPVVSTNASDLFLKTVLSNSSNTNSGVTPIKSNVKSSPLLNVLLDKGKLPEFSTNNVINNQVNASSLMSMSNSNATLMSSQTPKMYILTTKSPLAMKSVPSLQTQTLNQTLQCVPQNQLSPVCASLQTQNTSLKSCLQNSTAVVTTTAVSLTMATTATSNHSVAKQSIPKSCITTAINGEIGSPVHNNLVNHIANNVVNSDPTPAITTSSISFINSVPSSDLSPFKEIKKTVDDATRLLAKRPTESEESVGTNKKFKVNSVLTTSSSVTHNSIPNHDSNSCDSISIPLKNLSNNSQQVLTKALSPLTTSAIPLTVASTLTTITSNNIKPVCNTNIINGNNCNKDTNLSANTEFECQWDDCKKTFNRASEVFLHVHNHHIMSSTFPNVMNCLWGGQEGTGPGCLSKRPKLSLLTHLLDFHCNPNVLHQENVRKKQLSSVGSTSIVLPQPPAHPGYAHNAALLAIRRHANNYVEAPTLPPTNELTPLTVSIRLTSALILRNLAFHSNFVKRTLETFEQYLCELCMSDGRDESRTIAQCLALISDQT